MKKLVVLAVLLMAVPAMAAVDITVAKTGTNELTISYDATGEANNVRAYALEIIVDDPCISIASVDCSGNADYDIYPGSIVIVGSSVTADGTCLVEYGNEAPEPNRVIIEAGSLYPDGDPAPGKTGDLAVVTLDGTGCDSVGAAGTCNVRVEENAIRGGVVMENPDEVPMVNEASGEVGHDLSVCVAPTCLNDGATEFTEWQTWGEPNCWCYERQCRGDINGKLTMGKWVQGQDLTIFRDAFLLDDGPLAAVANGICADLNHKKTMGKRVQGQDLTILRDYFLEDVVPSCDDAPPSGTGPYNYWLTAP